MLKDVRAHARLRCTVVASAIVASSAAACGYSEDEMQVKRDRISELGQELAAARQAHEQLQTRFDELDQQNRRMVAQLQELGTNVEQLQSERSDLKRALEEHKARMQRAQERLKTFRKMLDQFHSMIASGKLRVRIGRGRMVVELAESILFDSGSARLKKGGKAALAQVAEVLKTIPDRDYQIAGHTDDVPIRGRRFASNWELSAARAVTVTRFVEAQGLESLHLSAAGYADTRPVASNEGPEGRAQNRRIEIVLMPNLDELPDLTLLTKLDS